MPLVPFRTLMQQAARGGYAVGYFECWNLDSYLAVADAAEACRSPVLLGVSGIYLPHPRRRVRDPLEVLAAAGLAVCRGLSVPACLVFNESPHFEWVLAAIDCGFGLVMYSDDSMSPAERRVRIREVAERAHAAGAAVEAELDPLPGVAGALPLDVQPGPLTDPSAACSLCEATGVDAVAINIGQLHAHGRRQVRLDLEHLARLRARLQVPMVLHGATSVDRGDLARAVAGGVRKVNVGSALKQVYLQALRAACIAESAGGNPYEAVGSGLECDVLTPPRLALRTEAESWMKCLGSAGAAASPESNLA